MKLNISTAVAIAALAMLAGCSGVKESDLVGKWTSRTEPEPANDSGAIQRMANAFGDALAPKLELKEDRTYTMTGVVPNQGTWELEDGQLLLTTEKVAGMDAKTVRGTDEPLALELSDDAKALTGTITMGSGSFSLRFTKVEE